MTHCTCCCSDACHASRKTATREITELGMSAEQNCPRTINSAGQATCLMVENESPHSRITRGGMYQFASTRAASVGVDHREGNTPETPQRDGCSCSYFLQRLLNADCCSSQLSPQVLYQLRDKQRNCRKLPKGANDSGILANQIVLYKWYLSRPKDGVKSEVVVGGLRAFGTAYDDRIETAAIVQRLEKCRLLTKDGVEVLLLGLIDDRATILNGFSVEILHSFLSGFPYTWDHLVAKECSDKVGITRCDTSVQCNLPIGENLSQLSLGEVNEENKGTSFPGCNDKATFQSCNESVENHDRRGGGMEAVENEVSAVTYQSKESRLPGIKEQEKVFSGFQHEDNGVSVVLETMEVEKEVHGRPLPSTAMSAKDENKERISNEPLKEHINKDDSGQVEELGRNGSISNEDETLANDVCTKHSAAVLGLGHEAANDRSGERSFKKVDGATSSKKKNQDYYLRHDEPHESLDENGEMRRCFRRSKRKSGCNPSNDFTVNISNEERTNPIPPIFVKRAFVKEVAVSPKEGGMFKRSSDVKIVPPPLPHSRIRVSKELVSTAFGLKMSRSGRLLVPPLAHWQGQRVVRDVDGGIIAIADGMEKSNKAAAGFKPPSGAALEKLQEELCMVATECLHKKGSEHHQKRSRLYKTRSKGWGKF